MPTLALLLLLSLQEKDVVKSSLLPPSINNPRNSEGDFIPLKDGLIMFVYTRFTGGTADDSRADLAAIFSEEPWLDLPPNPEAQAKVLSRLECIKPTVFHAVLERLSPVVRTATPPITSVTDETEGRPTKPEVKVSALQGNRLDPKGFLLGVMNDKTIELHLRIEAAKALLPYFEGGAAAESAEDRQII